VTFPTSQLRAEKAATLETSRYCVDCDLMRPSAAKNGTPKCVDGEGHVPVYRHVPRPLWDGDIAALTMALREIPLEGKNKDLLRTTIEYFNTNHLRMRYRLFREQGLFIGSGVVEAGCRSLIGERLKCSGMHWSMSGANAIIALRCCLESNRFEDYWEQRRPTAKAA